jgi:hypothetical protein
METELLGVGDRDEADSDLQLHYRELSSECVGDRLPHA